MLLTALILGFAGSLHCLGMCSPLALMVTGQSKSFSRRVVYNAGRILTYSVAGFIVASVGFALIFFKLQNVLTIALGVVLLAAGLGGATHLRIPFLTSAIARFSSRLRTYFSFFIQRKTFASVFFLGSLNGILPCGLSFIALTFCLSFDKPIEGFYFMMMFGVGTLPVMLGATSIVHWIMNRLNVSFSKISMAMFVLSGLLLIGRVFFDHGLHTPDPHASVVDIVLCR